MVMERFLVVYHGITHFSLKVTRDIFHGIPKSEFMNMKIPVADKSIIP